MTIRVEATLSIILATLLTPGCNWTSDVPLAVLDVECTVLIRDVETWHPDVQQTWIAWLSDTRLVRKSLRRGLPVVTPGLFLGDLYRLTPLFSMCGNPTGRPDVRAAPFDRTRTRRSRDGARAKEARYVADGLKRDEVKNGSIVDAG